MARHCDTRTAEGPAGRPAGLRSHAGAPLAGARGCAVVWTPTVLSDRRRPAERSRQPRGAMVAPPLRGSPGSPPARARALGAAHPVPARRARAGVRRPAASPATQGKSESRHGAAAGPAHRGPAGADPNPQGKPRRPPALSRPPPGRPTPSDEGGAPAPDAALDRGPLLLLLTRGGVTP